MTVIKSHRGLKSFRGLHSHRGLKSFRGLSGGGLRIPEGAKFYYLFCQSDLDAAKTEQVNGIAQVTTTRASTITIPQTAGGTLEFAAGEAAFDVGQNMQVHPSGFGGATADTRAQISMLDNPSWMIDSPSDNGGVNPFVLANYSAGSYDGGVLVVSDTVVSVRWKDGTKYPSLTDLILGCVIKTVDGLHITVISQNVLGTATCILLRNDTGLSFADACNGLKYTNPLTLIFAYSDYNTDFAAVKALRESAGDDLTGWSTPTLISDNAGGFKIELDIPDLDHSTGSCVLWKSGDSSLEYDATAGELQSKVAANTAVLALPDLSTAQKAAFVYQDGYVFATADDGPLYGPELIVNGDFSTWTGDNPDGWTVVGEDATHQVTQVAGGARYLSNTASPVLALIQDVLDPLGKYVMIIEIVDYVSGMLNSDKTDLPFGAGSGIYTINLKQNPNTFSIYRSGTDVELTIKSVSIREILGTATTAPALDATGDILQDGAGGGYADVPKIKAIYGGKI